MGFEGAQFLCNKSFRQTGVALQDYRRGLGHRTLASVFGANDREVGCAAPVQPLAGQAVGVFEPIQKPR